MRYFEKIKPISYFKVNTARVIEEITANRKPMIITKNGEATFVIQDIATFEDTQQTLTLQKLLAMGRQQIENGQFSSAEDVFAELEAED